MVRIAVAQMEGRTLAEAPQSLDAARSLVVEAAAQGAQIVVLPEGSYPGYVLGSATAGREALAAGPDPIETFGQMAADNEVTLVAGLVLDSPRGLLNAAVTFGPDGAVLSQVAKRFLWHFDHEWFVAGDESPVAATDHGSVGALVCADARQPAIAAEMAAQGAALICDPTAWVTSTPGSPSNIQPEFLIQARCIENGVVMACASKAGFEGPTVAYTGRSMIVSADGEVLAEAPTRGEVVMTADVELDGLPRPLVPKKPEWEEGLKSAWNAQPPSCDSVRVAAANYEPGDAELRQLRVEGVDIVVTPSEVKCLTETPVRTVELSAEDLLAPEPARIAARGGAELIVAPCGDTEVPLVVLRARAAENRVFLATSHVVVAPSGAVVADAPPDRQAVASASGAVAEAAVKTMAPRTGIDAW